MKRLSLIFLFSSFAFGQGVVVPTQQALKTVNGITSPVANATITVCAANTSGIPCSPVLVSALFKDAALTQPLSNPFTSDANGNYVFAITPGNYTVTVTALGFVGYSYQTTAPVSAAATNSFSSTNTFSGVTNLNGGGSLTGTFSGPTTFSGNNTFSGNSAFFLVNGLTCNANQASGADLGAQINTCDSVTLSGIKGQIHVTASGSVSEQVTISSNHELICDGDQVTLTYTNTTANITQNSNTRIRNCAISSTQTAAPTNSGEINAAGVSNIQIDNVTFTGGGAHILYNGVSGFLIRNTRHVSITAASVSVISVTNSVKGKITLSRVESFVMPTSAVFLPIIDFQGLSAGACDRIDAVANTVDGVDATTVQGSAAIAFNGCSNVNIIGGSYSNNNNMDGVLVNGSGNGLVPSSNVNVVGVTSTNNSNVAGSGSNAHNGDGLDVFNADKVNITGGDFGNNGNLSTNRNNCMDDYNNTNVTITGGGNYSDCGAQGIQIASSPRTRVTGAYIDRNRLNGVALQQTATMTCNTSGTAVTVATGPGFGLGWILGTLMVINNVTYYIQSVNSTSSITLQSTAGTQSGVACFVDSYDEVIDGNEIVDNGVGLQGGSLQQGVQAVGSASGIVVNNIITDTRSSGKTQLYGIRTDNTAVLSIGNNIMFLNGTGNSTGAILDNAGNASYFNQIKDTFNNAYYQPGGPGNTSVFLDAGTVVGEVQLGVNHAADIVAAVPLKIKEVAAPSGVAGFEMCYGDSTAHAVKCSYNNGTFLNIPQVIGSGTATMTTAAIAAGSCGTTVTVAAAGVATTDTITWAFNAAPGGQNAGLVAWPTSGNVNFAYCSNTAETPAAATINWRVIR